VRTEDERRTGAQGSRNAEEHADAWQCRNRLQRFAVTRRARLLVGSDQTECCCAFDLGYELLVVAAVCRLPVRTAKGRPDPAEHGEVDAEQPPDTKRAGKRGIRAAGGDVADGHRRLVQAAAAKCTCRLARPEPLKLDGHSFTPHDDPAARAAHEPERSRDEARRRADDGQRIGKAAPRIGQANEQRRRRAGGDAFGVGEQPARRSIA